MNVEVKSKGSGEKTVVPIEEVRKGIKYGKDLTGYEKNMLGNGIGKMESKDYVYTVINSTPRSSNPVVQNALAAKGVARNGFYKTEEEAEYRAEQFVSAALNRIKGDIDGEIKTVSDCIKLFKGAPMSDKAKSDLERLKAHLAKLNKCKAMF